MATSKRELTRAIARGKPGPRGFTPQPVWNGPLLSFEDGNGDPYGPPPANLLGPEGPAANTGSFQTQAQLAASVTHVGVAGIRLLGALAPGDDGDAILTQIAAPSIIKPWHKPSNNGWFELMSSVGTLKFFGGKSSGSIANKTANNQALKDIAQWVTERKIAGCATEMTFHPGVYDYDDNSFQLAQQSAVLRSIGRPILRYHGGDDALVLDGLAAPPAFGVKQFRMIGNLTVQSNSSAKNAIVVRSLLDSDLDLTCGGGSSAYAGLRLEFGVCARIRYSCSSNYKDEDGDPWWADGVAPSYGVYATELAVPPAPDFQTPNAFCTLLPIIEGVNYGVWADKVNGLRIRDGTIEGCTTTGLTIDRNSSSILVEGTDFESNAMQDIYVSGSDCTFLGINCGNVVTFGTNAPATASRNRLIGGVCNTVVFAADTAYNQVDTVFNITGTGGISDSGNYNRTKGSFDAANAAYYTRARFSPTISGSPYLFQNTTGDDLMVSVSGGTVSAINLKPRATGSFISAGVTAGLFLLAPKDQIQIIGPAVPAVSVWGV
jgi:hypothetical protein